MKTKPDNLLTPEERELAQLTRRLGPQGGPSPALDARILAAADAAVATRPARTPKPRWPVAIGLAASVVFAVGIAWQLRPVQQAAIVTEAPVAYSPRQPSAAASHESKAVAGQAAEAAEDAVAAETTVPEAVVADARGPAASAAAVVVAPGAPAMTSRPVPAVASAPLPRPPVRAMPAEAPSVARESREERYSAQAAPPPPRAPAPFVSATATEPAPGFVADAPADASAGQQAAAIEGALRSSNAATAKQSAPRDDARARAGREAERRALDRVEVSGSRLKRTDLQVPVAEDAQLAVDEWLERVRTRYGLGDAGAARQSLLLFMKDHPGEPIPGDLEPLLDE